VSFFSEESNCLPPYHLHCSIPQVGIATNAHTLRWHKRWMAGLYLAKYHRTFHDGFPGFPLPSGFTIPTPSDTFDDAFDDADDFLPLELPHDYPISSVEKTPAAPTPLSPYWHVRNVYDEISKLLANACSHQEEMATKLIENGPDIYEFAMNKVRPLLNQTGYMIVDSTLPTDQSRSKKRLRAAYEGPQRKEITKKKSAFD